MRILLLLMMAWSLPLSAQFHGQAAVNFIVGVPQNEFETNVDNNGYGIDLEGGVVFAPAPFMLGGDIGFLVYGSESRNEPFSTTIPDVTVDVNTTNNIVFANLFLRLQPDFGFVKPYADGIIGFKYLFTRTTIENEGFDDEEIASSTNFDDTAFSYGFGGGVHIRLTTLGGFENETGPTLLLHLGARLLKGSEAEYLKEGSIRRENGEVEFDVEKSETDILLFRIGLGLEF